MTRKRLFIFPVVFLILALGGYFLLRSKIGPFAPAILTPATAYWAFDEGYGQTLNDQSGNANTGTLGADSTPAADDPAWATEDLCITGKCLKFTSGSSQYVDVAGSIASINTVSFWVRPSSVASISLLVLNGAAGNASLTTNAGGVIQAGAGFTSPTIYVNGSVTSTLIANRWQHVAVTTASDITASNVMLGRVNTGYFNGFIDEVKLYNYALTVTQVAPDSASRGSPGGAAAAIYPDYKWLSDGLVGYWNLNEISAGAGAVSRVDSSGNNNTLTDFNTTPSGPGKFSHSSNFARTNSEYLSIADGSQSGLDITSDLTVSAWINPQNLGSYSAMSIVSKKNSYNTDYAYQLVVNQNGTVYFGISQNGTDRTEASTAAGVVVQDTWTHVSAVVKPGQNISIYINGILSPNGATNPLTISQTAIYNSSYAFQIAGDGAEANYFNGYIDDVRIYNRDLTPSEIDGLYSQVPGPILHWKFDEGTGTFANDSSGNDNTGDLGGVTHLANISPVWASGKFGSALRFDGATAAEDYISATTNNIIDGASAFTFSTWVKYDTLEDSEMIVQKSQDSTHYYSLGLSWSGSQGSNDFSFCVSNHASNDSCGDTSGNIVQTNTWYHVVGVFDGTQSTDANRAKLYVNGVPQTLTFSTTIPATTATYDQPIYIGAFGANATIGLIDDFKIYNYPLTTSQITQDMNAGHPAPGSPVGSAALHLKFEEDYGNTAHNAGNLGSVLDADLGGVAFDCPPGAACPVQSTSGKYGKALSFDGSDYIETANHAIFNSETFTYSAWLYRTGAVDGSNGAGIAGRWNTNQGAFLWVDPSNVIEFPIAISPHLSSGVTAELNTWYHVVGTFDGTTSTIYVNGVKQASQAEITDFFSITQGFEVGRYAQAAATYFTGLIDEVKYYNQALTEAQVKVEYNQGKAIVWGSSGTDASNNSTLSMNDQYCPPGLGSACTPPVAHWKLDESAGQYIYDSSSNLNLGCLGNENVACSTPSTQVSDPARTTGKIGQALFFDGSDDLAGFVDSNSTDIGTSDLTLEAWVYRSTAVNDEIVISKRPGGLGTDCSGAQIGYQLVFYSTDELAVALCDGTNGWEMYTASNAAPAGVWNHIATTINRSTPTSSAIYINGQPVSTTLGGTMPTGTLANTTGLQYAMQGSSNLPFRGYLDNVLLYNYARTPAQIAWDFNRGGPVAWYKFDEASWTNNCSTDTVFNSISNTFHGHSCPNGTGQTTPETGKWNNAMHFDGSNDYVDIGNNFHYSLPISFSAWVNLDSNSIVQNIVATDKTGHTNHTGAWLDVTTTGLADVGFADNTACGDTSYRRKTGTTVLSTGVWYHIVGVIRGTTDMDVYVNGRNDAGTYDGTGGTIAYTGDSGAIGKIGNCPTGDLFFDGLIDDLRIYPYPLTSAQVKTLYNSNSAVRY